MTRMKKRKNTAPLQPEVLQHVETCINTAVMSALSRKKVTGAESIHIHLSLLQQRLLQLCKDMRVPSTKLGKLRSLGRDVQEEQRRMEGYEETLEALSQEIEEAVETRDNMEKATDGRMRTLQEGEAPQSSNLFLSNTDPLPLPPGTFRAPTMQDRVKKLQDPEAVLQEVSEVRSDPAYRRMHRLLPMCYAEISSPR